MINPAEPKNISEGDFNIKKSSKKKQSIVNNAPIIVPNAPVITAEPKSINEGDSGLKKSAKKKQTSEPIRPISTEDYADDFEDEVDTIEDAKRKEEIRNIQIALNEENAAVKNRQNSLTNTTTPVIEKRKEEKTKEVKSTIPRSILELKQSTNPKIQRIKEILRYKKFTIEKFHLYSQFSATPYELYSRRLRTGYLRQLYVQTRDEERIAIVQTESMEKLDKSMQFPDDIGTYTGKSTDTRRFLKFIDQAAKICEILIEENEHQEKTVTANDQSIRKSYTEEVMLGEKNEMVYMILKQWKLTYLTFSLHVSSWVLTVHTPREKNENKSLVFLWDLTMPEHPRRLLYCYGTLVCVTSGPGRSSYIFGGSAEGSLYLWDINQSITNVYTMNIAGKNKTFMAPTYISSGRPQDSDDHISSICGLSILQHKSKGNFQVASLDDHGIINFWAVIASNEDDLEKQTKDPCMFFGARCKLLRSGVIKLAHLFPNQIDSYGPFATCLAVLPDDPSEYLIGTNFGKIFRCSRVGKSEGPQCYEMTIRSEPIENICTIHSIKFSPFFREYFLVSAENGQINLFVLSVRYPLTTWNTKDIGISITGIEWSSTRPGVFHVSYTDESLETFDLLRDYQDPILKEQLHLMPQVNTAFAVTSQNIKNYPYSMLTQTTSGELMMKKFCPFLLIPTTKEKENVSNILQKLSI